MECGIAIAGYGDIKVGDVIEAFSVVKVAAELTTAYAACSVASV